ncbi:MAG: M15 family metallopeptidase [Treponema sp.]|jgi:D-alanyl-D-alanine carboxypeptidase|nr:M15 family metallopeptidase [Treponema sp.]
MKKALGAVLLSLCLISCDRTPSPRPVAGEVPREIPRGVPQETGEEELPDLAEAIAMLTEKDGDSEIPAGGTGSSARVLARAALPPEMTLKLEAAIAESPAFILELLTCLEGDPFLRRLVDKTHSLPEAYEPEDLVELKPGSYEVGRSGLRLRREAAEALETMAAAARSDGVILVASSAYRSYEYQVQVYNRIVGEMGREAADRESARPGYSQHQTGLTLDFGSIDDSFAQTRAGRWILENAGRFGWSLSFPNGYEEVTGYRWESWHYRYVGRDLAAFIDNWFGGIQQYALQFIHAWEEEE